MTGRVVVTQPLVGTALDDLANAGCTVELLSTEGPPDPGVLRSAVVGADALVCLLSDVVDDAVVAAGAPTLRVISNVAVGVDNIDLGAAASHGVVVCNTPGVLDAATADLTMALLLAVCRQVVSGMDRIRRGEWSGFSTGTSLGRDLAGMRLGLVGYGGIARKVAQRAAAFEMQVRHHARHDTGLPGFVGALDDLVAWSEAVSLHVPLTKATTHLLDARRIALLPSGAIVINAARGPVIDEAALIGALRSGHLGGAGLDVFDDEPYVDEALLAMPNVVVTPHIGSATTATRAAMSSMAIEAVLCVLDGRTWPHVVGAHGTAPRDRR